MKWYIVTCYKLILRFVAYGQTDEIWCAINTVPLQKGSDDASVLW